MVRYLVHRVPSAVAVLVLASVLIFFVLRLVPGDPASTLAGPDASPEAIERSVIRSDSIVPSRPSTWRGSAM